MRKFVASLVISLATGCRTAHSANIYSFHRWQLTVVRMRPIWILNRINHNHSHLPQPIYCKNERSVACKNHRLPRSMPNRCRTVASRWSHRIDRPHWTRSMSSENFDTHQSPKWSIAATETTENRWSLANGSVRIIRPAEERQILIWLLLFTMLHWTAEHTMHTHERWS